MQALIPVFAILSVAAAAQLTLLPYAYLADPLPVYQQSQDTQNGVHAYSYAGGPSAKEEVRGLDGVTRGSYSYLDAHGILQSVFYVADEGGFRVAATNLPTDGDLPQETGEILLAKNAHLREHARAAQKAKEAQEQQRTDRRKRSIETAAAAPADRDNPQAEKSSSQGDQADQQQPAQASPKSSHELPAPEKKIETIAPVYGFLDSVPKLSDAATSHQSRVDVHSNIHLKAIQPVQAIGVLAEPAYGAVILPGQVPLATSHQTRFQVHNNLRAEALPDKPIEKPETSSPAQEPAVQPATPVVNYQLEALPLADYNENRIQLHKNIGLEGPNPKDAVKINVAPLKVVETPAAIAAVPIIAKEAALPLATAVFSQSRTQIHRNTKLKVALPVVSQPTVYLAASYVRPIANWPILAVPVTQSSQHRSQEIHSSQKIEVTA